MPSDGADFTGRMATVTGWGRLKYNGGVPSVLQEVQVSTLAARCSRYQLHQTPFTSLTLYSSLAAPRTLDSHSLVTSHAHKLRYITSHFVQYFFLFLRFLLLFTHFRRLGANY